MDKFRSRKFCLLLYPLEDVTHKNALEYIKSNFDCAYITHDKDLTSEGEIKKSHVHVVISFSNAKWNTSVCDEIGITTNYMQKCKDFEKALDYLIHFNDDSKHQYDISEVHGNLKSRLVQIINNSDKTESEKTFEILEYIENSERVISVTELSKYCASIGRWDIFRRASLIYIKILEEHNQYIIDNLPYK